MRNTKYIILIFLISIFQNNNCVVALTYAFSGGRFGDNLLSYIHAKWLSYKFNLPLLYIPFTYSDKLALHKNELYYDKENHKFTFIFEINKLLDHIKTNNDFLKKSSLSRLETNKYILNQVLGTNQIEKIIFVIPYFPESLNELQKGEFSHAFEIDWKDNNFIKILRENIKPTIDLPDFNIPEGYISIALHVRKGSELDLATPQELTSLKKSFPFKFLDEQFYIEQIKKLSEIFSNKKLYICLFTDYSNSDELMKRFKKNIQNPNIFFDYKKPTGNIKDINILDDFFSILKFDCIIRSNSNFALVAAKLGNFKIEISPFSVQNKNSQFFVKKAKLIDKDYGTLIYDIF